jgi:AcrR family transcriptional regulator
VPIVRERRRTARPRLRDRDATRKRILDATGRILSRRGFRGLGINAVAAAAGVDKVLIYRYFGGLPELLDAFARQAEFWPQEAELLRDAPASAPGFAAAVLKALLRALLSRPLTQEVLRWELSASNALVGKLAAVREEQGLPVLSRMAVGRRPASGLDVPAIAALLSAGITHLVLRSTSGVTWLGISLQSPAGKRRIERAIDQVVSRVLEPGAKIERRGTHEALARGSNLSWPRRRRRPRRRSPVARR